MNSLLVKFNDRLSDLKLINLLQKAAFVSLNDEEKFK